MMIRSPAPQDIGRNSVTKWLLRDTNPLMLPSNGVSETANTGDIMPLTMSAIVAQRPIDRQDHRPPHSAHRALLFTRYSPVLGKE
jgi:hypothetical protein